MTDTAKAWTHPDTVGSWIDGREVIGNGRRLPVVDPASEAQVAELAEADEAMTDRAVRSAQAAFEDGRWWRLPANRRRDILRSIAVLTAQHLEELAWLEARNAGLPIRYLRQRQMPRILRNFDFFADHLSQSTEMAGTEDQSMLRYVVREPLGTVALISPWNAPLALASTKIAAALCFGNSCVLKTAEQTPLAVARFMRILADAGVPDGVVNLINGAGTLTGAALTRHPLVRGVSFTGGGTAGRAIAAAAAPQLKRIDLELGGKSANIITESADLDRAVDGALAGIYLNNGQQCFAGSRILVQRSIAGQFIDAFVDRSERIVVGHPMSDSTEIGPLAHRAHYERVTGWFETIRRDSLSVLTGGQRARGFERGFYVEPTAVLLDNQDHPITREEIFGPVASVLVFDEIDQAIALANDSEYGLVTYLWTDRLQDAHRTAAALQSGVVLVNTNMTLDLRFPFGGYKDSGLGREGIEGFRNFYSQDKTVTVALRPSEPMSFGRGARRVG